MTETPPPNRSNELMSPHDTALLVVDVQQKFMPIVQQSERMVWNIRRLLDAAQLLGIASRATEQYPQGLGATVAELAERLPTVDEKLRFSSSQVPGLVEDWTAAGIHKVLLVGIEAHVCIQQTALDLLSEGYPVYLAVDAISSRNPLDGEVALRRMESCGAILTTTEACLFEWCESAEHEHFKQISALAKEVFAD
jgi:nicotinamidase-related amidase